MIHFVILVFIMSFALSMFYQMISLCKKDKDEIMPFIPQSISGIGISLISSVMFTCLVTGYFLIISNI